MTTIVFGDYTYKAISDDNGTTIIVKNIKTNEFYQKTYPITGNYSNCCGNSYVNYKQIIASSKTKIASITKEITILNIHISYDDDFHFCAHLTPTKCDVANLKLFDFTNFNDYFQTISTNINLLFSRFNGKCGDIVFEEDLPITFEEIERKFEEITFVSLQQAETIPPLAKYCDVVKLIRETYEEQQKEVDVLIGLEVDKMKKQIEQLSCESDDFIVATQSHKKITHTYPQFTFVGGRIASVHISKREIEWKKENVLKLVATHKNKNANYGMFLGKYTEMLTSKICRNGVTIHPTESNIKTHVYENFAKINPNFTLETINKLFPFVMTLSSLKHPVLYIDCTKCTTTEQQFVINALDETLEIWAKTGKFIL